MSRFNKEASTIITRACEREDSYASVCWLYGISRPLLDCYLKGEDCGPLTARKVIRVELGRMQAEKEGRTYIPTHLDRYKGAAERTARMKAKNEFKRL